MAHGPTTPIMISERSDSELARGVASGDRTSLEEVFRRYGGAVNSVARRVIRNPEYAEDVVQETFVSYWKSPAGFDPERGSLRTYLLTIAHRRAVDIVRSEEARSRREQAPPDPSYFSIEEEVVSQIDSERVRDALTDLDKKEREAIAMAYFGGLSYVEVARQLGAPEGTVKSRIRTGMRKLAVELVGLES